MEPSRRNPHTSNERAHRDSFGSPIFGFVEQHRLAERGWSWIAHNGDTISAQHHYWVADDGGDFGFTETPVGKLGSRELLGFVFTDKILDEDDRTLILRSTLNNHIEYVVRNWGQLIDGVEKQSSNYEDILLVEETPTEVFIDDQAIPAVEVKYSNFYGTSAMYRSRVVTRIIAENDFGKIDSNLRELTSEG